ncbi:Hsp70 family protein [Vulgatibacter sp.]|uniref:Hsp70 family protein n=1 Tax=Vulgatibacter sp. TaxID=1971226 RepID=UPI003562CE78
MAGVRVGVDFGTSNSAAALPGPRPGAPARVIAVDPAGEDARLFRSVLYFPDGSRETLAGGEAIVRYLDEIDGRFIQSAKSFLPSTSFHATEVRGRSLRLEELVAIVLRRMRERIEEEAGGPVERVVFGRPAVFSTEPEKDRIAEERLCRAAEIAGFPTPTFLIEPIAAALGYEAGLDHDEVVLVGDFGAGTSDFTLMRLGPSRTENVDRREDVIASTGVYVGGDNFDAAIVENRLLQRFGEGTTYKAFTQRMPMPTWMPRKLLAWHELALLRERSTLEFLRKAVVTADDPTAVQNLVTLIEDNLAYQLYRAVEAAKRRLGEEEEAAVSFHEGGIEVEELVTRADFESWTAPLRAQLEASVDRVLEQAGGVEPDAIFLTGGTSKIPAVRRIFEERFGADRIRSGDAFTSVVAGLGRAAAG